MARPTRRQREEAYRAEVEAHKERIAETIKGGVHIYGVEHHRQALRNGEHARAQALEEMMPVIREHNKRAGGGTRGRIQDELKRQRQESYERRRKKDIERAERMVEDGRSGSAPARDSRLGRKRQERDVPNSAPTFGALGRKRHGGRGRPPWA